MHYIGLDVHKRTISYCVKEGSGQIHAEGTIPATRFDLDRWMKTLPQPWTAAMEATVSTGWDLRSLAAPRRGVKGCSSADAACHCSGKKEERSHRRQQDLRLSALRFSAGVLHSSTELERRHTLRYRTDMGWPRLSRMENCEKGFHFHSNEIEAGEGQISVTYVSETPLLASDTHPRNRKKREIGVSP